MHGADDVRPQEDNCVIHLPGISAYQLREGLRSFSIHL